MDQQIAKVNGMIIEPPETTPLRPYLPGAWYSTFFPNA